MDAPLTPLVTESNEAFVCFLQGVHRYTMTASALMAAWVKTNRLAPLESALYWGSKAAERCTDEQWGCIRSSRNLLRAFPESGMWRATLAAEKGGAA